MVYNRRFSRVAVVKTIGCSCGAQVKQSSRKNYPFGKKSGSIRSYYYKCKSCDKLNLPIKEEGGKK